jgi:hypothetical protein
MANNILSTHQFQEVKTDYERRAFGIGHKKRKAGFFPAFLLENAF